MCSRTGAWSQLDADPCTGFLFFRSWKRSHKVRKEGWPRPAHAESRKRDGSQKFSLISAIQRGTWYGN